MNEKGETPFQVASSRGEQAIIHLLSKDMKSELLLSFSAATSTLA